MIEFGALLRPYRGDEAVGDPALRIPGLQGVEDDGTEPLHGLVALRLGALGLVVLLERGGEVRDRGLGVPNGDLGAIMLPAAIPPTRSSCSE